MPPLTTRIAAALLAASMLWTATLGTPAVQVAAAQPTLLTALA